MKQSDLEATNAKRLHEWKQVLDYHHATPLVAVGVGHDHNAGQRYVLTCQGLESEQVVAMLEAALADLKRPRGARQGDTETRRQAAPSP